MEKTNNIFEINIEKHLSRVLFRQNSKAQVLSKTENSVFIKTDSGKFITFCCGKNKEPNPQTVVFSKKIPEFFNKNNSFYFDKIGLKSEKDRIDFRKNDFSQNHVSSIKWERINKENVKKIKNWLVNKPFEGMTEIFCEEESSFKIFLKPFLKDLKQAFYNGNNSAFFNILTNMSGAGPGLTPATDDFICGILIVLSILNNSNLLSKEWKVPKLRILRDTKGKTNHLSWNFIKISLSGFISTWQYELLKDIENDLKENILDNIDYGSTSGRDITTGIYFMLQLVSERRSVNE
ncbi:MAG: hypothetical protein C0601_00855 [Candidatus Muiribacterium halophilum]|uniref:DUF2877 domain-containing protein n=1 Tax=Muiribacterium halophilum TaxID=2053465 RepID=A0A2N5ZM64_MUIH1|nr:MAG: hypothetical protein C0601_00855 [Candidatus Muirbacterium halophilum]